MSKAYTDKQSEQAHALLEELCRRADYRQEGMRSSTGHLGICSCQCGPPEECHICGTTVRSINFMNEVDLGQGDIAVTYEEGERQMVLMALAHLALERPGWNAALSTLALRMDNKDHEGRPVMFEQFKESHVAALRQMLREETPSQIPAPK